VPIEQLDKIKKKMQKINKRLPIAKLWLRFKVQRIKSFYINFFK
jgi:hypothetical protein